ncbi:MAG: PAS domain S-box protein [Flammeovirgaceae bacterium]|nr:PAS domain S-box protein [Flammeovirgaceae bacterium]
MKSLATYVKKGLFYKSVVDDGSDIIFIVNYEGAILYHNHSVQETLGYKTSGLVGKNFFDYLPAHLLADFKKEFNKSTRRAYNKSIEFQFICRDKDINT